MTASLSVATSNLPSGSTQSRSLQPKVDTLSARSLTQLFELREFAAAERSEVEAFIADRYTQAYGAQLRHFLPRLFGLHSKQRELLAAFGLREGRGGPLFLEHYLDRPIEKIAAEITGKKISREKIVEVGNLAGRHRGALRLLIPLLAQKLNSENLRWLAFTGSPRLINGFSKLGIELTPLTAARPDRLPPEEQGEWGSYYAHDPMVMLGDIASGVRHLEQNSQLLQELGETSQLLAGASE